MQDGARGAYGLRLLLKAEAGEGLYAKLAAKRLMPAAVFKAPVLQSAEMNTLWQRYASLRPALRQQHLAWGQTRQLLEHQHGAMFTVQPGRREFAGANVHPGEPGRLPAATGGIAIRQERKQIVWPIFGQQLGFDDRAGRDDSRDLALDDALGRRLAHLVADGDVKALVNQARYVVLQRVMGHACHGDAAVIFAGADRTAGQRQVQRPGGHFRVFVKGFVEIAQAEEQDTIGIVGLDVQVLLAQWRGSGHG